VQELKVCVFDAGGSPRVGSLVGEDVYDLNLCCVQHLAVQKNISDAWRLANSLVPGQLGAFLSGGGSVLSAARDALEFVLKEGSRETLTGDNLAYSAKTVRLLAPILPTSTIFCMALAYKSHADVGGKIPYVFPNWFTKTTNTVADPDAWVILPKNHPEPVVYGTEMTLVIGKRGKCIPEEQALDHIWGFTILNDVTLREQKGRPDRPARKEFDTSAPIGPWIIPRDQIADPKNLKLTFRINGRQVQDGITSNLLWPLPAIVSEISKWLTLQPGDVIATGDVGAREPLKPGDVMEAEVEGIGVLRNPVKLEE